MKISVITINYNTGREFLRTKASVTSQSYSNIEWVVIDGGSTDDSMNEILKSKDLIDILIIGKDRGISHAFNKGIDAATGDALIFMNSGDTFSDSGALLGIFQAWDVRHNAWICGGGYITNENGLKTRRELHNYTPKKLIENGCKILHASVLIRTDLIRSFSGYSENYRSAMDFDLWVRLIARGFEPQIWDGAVSNFYLGGISASYSGFEEEICSLKENGMLKQHAIIRMKLRKYLVSRLSFLKKNKYVYRLKELIAL